MRIYIFIIAFTCLVSACTSVPNLSDIAKLSPFYKANEMKSISVYAMHNNGLRYAVSVNVVFVYSEALLTSISGMNPSDWFAQKSVLTSGFGNQIDVLDSQMVAGYAEENIPLPVNHSNAVAVIAFANYPNNPDAKLLLTDMENPWLVFSGGMINAVPHAPTP